MKTNLELINHLIDHTLLTTNASKESMEKLVKEAKEYNFNSVCLRPEWVKDFSSEYKVSAVIAFPKEFIECGDVADITYAKARLGNVNLKDKIQETQEALENGALELDPVIQVSNVNFLEIEEQEALKSELGTYFSLADDFAEKNNKSIWIKPIFSCECLDDEEIDLSVSIMAEAVLDFKIARPKTKLKFAYKNSTGFVKGLEKLGASPELISKISESLDLYDPEKNISIKAAGGIKTTEDAQKIIEAANGRLSHIGTSNGVKISSP